MGLLVLVRHGESRWNLDNKFTGWVDVPLSQQGINEAKRCAKHCRKFEFDCAYTSRLERAHETIQIILGDQDRTGVVQHEGINPKYREWIRRSNRVDGDIPVFTSEDLNERYYGDLQGMNKKQAERKYGLRRLLAWRRGYDTRPPKGESLKDAFDRIMPFVRENVFLPVMRGDHALLVAHGNTLRAIIKDLEGISDEDIADVDLPEARPLVYRFTRKRWEHIAGTYDHGRPLR